MREIKFRAWNKDLNSNGGMIWNVAVLNGKYFDPYKMETQEYPLMQYTGLKDNNGKGIYEGDIVRDYDVEVGYMYSSVVFSKCSYYIHEEGYDLELLLEDIAEDCEIVGNIYENLKLLEVNHESSTN